jgi:hypothetical protein
LGEQHGNCIEKKEKEPVLLGGWDWRWKRIYERDAGSFSFFTKEKIS